MADPQLDAAITERLTALDELSQAFTQGAQKAEAKIAVARGTGVGSPLWLDAHAAMAELDTLRAPLLTILTELEELATARGLDGKATYPALDSAIARADALNKEQEARAKSLEAVLASI